MCIITYCLPTLQKTQYLCVTKINLLTTFMETLSEHSDLRHITPCLWVSVSRRFNALRSFVIPVTLTQGQSVTAHKACISITIAVKI